MILKYAGSLLVIAAGAALGSLLWPRLTQTPPPQPVSEMRRAVVSTGAGAAAAEVLGVSDVTKAEPITARSVGDTVTKTIKDGVESYAREAVASYATEQFLRQWPSLPDREKEKVRAAVCGK